MNDVIKSSSVYTLETRMKRKCEWELLLCW